MGNWSSLGKFGHIVLLVRLDRSRITPDPSDTMALGRHSSPANGDLAVPEAKEKASLFPVDVVPKLPHH